MVERGLNRTDLALLVLLSDQNGHDLVKAQIRLIDDRLLLLLLLRSLLHQVLRLAICVTRRFVLVASIALHTALEVVVLALAAHPATVRERKVLLVRRVTVCAITAHIKSTSRVILFAKRQLASLFGTASISISMSFLLLLLHLLVLSPGLLASMIFLLARSIFPGLPLAGVF